jgi:uncharacterized protein
MRPSALLILLGGALIVASGGLLMTRTRAPAPIAAPIAAPVAPTPVSHLAGLNRLADEPSLYLRQHAANPIDWYPWGEEALARAQDEDRPIFLSIGYASCHWCHVMEAEVFERRDVAEFMNRHYVCVKVDREERPDLDAAYMDALQAMTGSGGWPMSLFLTPAQRPFYGATYLPREQFLSVAAQLVEMMRTRRDEVDHRADQVYARVSASLSDGAAAPIDEAAVAKALEDMGRAFDPVWGGIGQRMKFPTPARWMYVLHHHRRHGDEAAGLMVQSTLTHMAAGGLQDHVSGGFHRYTVDRSWTVPHFEKMLYDNALMAQLYLEAAAVFDAPRFDEVVRRTLDFMLEEMALSDGGFAASFDADSGGEEGSFYVWTPQEISAAVGAEDGPILARLLGVTAQGSFEGGRSVLTRRADLEALAAESGRDVAALDALLDRHRSALRQFRALRLAPVRDPKRVTSWNGMAISAFARAAFAYDDPRYLAAAHATAEVLWRDHRRPDGSLIVASTDGRARGVGVLADHAFLALGLLDLYQATGAWPFAERALEVVDHVRARFAAEGGAFYDTPQGQAAPMGRQVEWLDHAVPCGGAAMLQVLTRAAALTGRAELRLDLERALTRAASLVPRAGAEMAWTLDARLLSSGPFYEVVLAQDGPRSALVEVLARLRPPHVVVARVAAQGPNERERALLPPLTGKIAREGLATAYVCERGRCLAPTSAPETLARQVRHGWRR